MRKGAVCALVKASRSGVGDVDDSHNIGTIVWRLQAGASRGSIVTKSYKNKKKK